MRTNFGGGRRVLAARARARPLVSYLFVWSFVLGRGDLEAPAGGEVDGAEERLAGVWEDGDGGAVVGGRAPLFVRTTDSPRKGEDGRAAPGAGEPSARKARDAAPGRRASAPAHGR